MAIYQGFLSVLVTHSLLGLSIAQLCPSEFMPYTCTSCIDFTKEKLAFDKTCTAPDTVLVKVENDEQMEVLRRYMEIFNQSKVWVDHNKTTMMNDDCSEHCCVALQLDPYKPVTVDCSTELSAICSTEVDALDFSEGSGGNDLGAGIMVTVDGKEEFEKMLIITYDATVNLTCDHASNEFVEWHINAQQQEDGISNSAMESTFMFKFSTPGIYQCKVNDSNGDTEIRTVTLCGKDTTPGVVEILSAFPLSQTELLVSWYPPTILGTISPLLLRYNIYYTSDSIFDPDSALVSSNVLPQLLDGSIKNGVGEIVIPGLKVGQSYLISVIATSTVQIPSTNFQFITKASTYGRAPVTTEFFLKVQRSYDNKTLVVSWQPAILEPPLGPVALYEVQYRDAQQSVITTAHVQPETPFLVIRDVANANDYEVRIAILVEVSRNPIEHERSSWTEWMRVNGTTTSIPSGVSPTGTEPTVDNLELIIAAVLLPAAVIIIVLLLLLLAALRICRNNSGGGYDVRKKEKFFPLSERDKRDSL